MQFFLRDLNHKRHEVHCMKIGFCFFYVTYWETRLFILDSKDSQINIISDKANDEHLLSN